MVAEPIAVDRDPVIAVGVAEPEDDKIGRLLAAVSALSTADRPWQAMLPSDLVVPPFGEAGEGHERWHRSSSSRFAYSTLFFHGSLPSNDKGIRLGRDKPPTVGRFLRDRGVRLVGTLPLLRVHGFVLPTALGPFVPAIERSRTMLALEDDWDGEGSPGYAEETWRRAVGIAINSAKSFVSSHDAAPPIPTFSKGPEGSVDVLWRATSKKAMINVPAEADQPVTYHGYDRENANREIKGVLDSADRNEWMLSWLTE